MVDNSSSRPEDIPGWERAVRERHPIGQITESPVVAVDLDSYEAFSRGTWLEEAYPDPDPVEYGDDMVPGLMSLALIDALGVFAARSAGTAGPHPDTYVFNYGFNRVRFVHPVRIGDEVSARFETRTVERHGEGLLIGRDCTMRLAHSGEVALVAQTLSLHLPQASAVADSVNGS